MATQSDSARLRRSADIFQLLPRLAGGLVAVLGGVALIGWIFAISFLTSEASGFTMKVNTAVSFILAGLALNLCIGSTSRARAAGVICALFVTATGLITLIEYAVNADLRIDQALARAPAHQLDASAPGRMAPDVALGFVFAGCSIIFQRLSSRATTMLRQMMLLLLSLLAFIALVGYSLSIRTLYSVGGSTSMTL